MAGHTNHFSNMLLMENSKTLISDRFPQMSSHKGRCAAKQVWFVAKLFSLRQLSFVDSLGRGTVRTCFLLVCLFLWMVVTESFKQPRITNMRCGFSLIFSTTNKNLWFFCLGHMALLVHMERNVVFCGKRRLRNRSYSRKMCWVNQKLSRKRFLIW